MKRAKRLYGLLGILVILCAVTFAVNKYEEKKEKIKNSDEIILTLDPENVTNLSWSYSDISLSFHKEENWVYDEDAEFPVDEEKIAGLLEIFEEFGVSFVIEDTEETGAYGLDQPECTIQIQTEDQDYEILLGDFSTMDSQRYVSIGDGNVYLVKTDPLDTYEVTLEDMIQNDTIPVFEQAEKITFSGAYDYEISYEEESQESYCEEDVYFTERNGKKVPLDTSNVEDYLEVICNLSQDEYVSYHASSEELESFGLDTPELVINVADSQGNFKLSIAKDSEDEAEEITAYARIGESKIIYRLSGDDYETLMAASYDDLRHQEVFSGAFAEVVQIDISLDGKSYTITSQEEDDTLVYYYNEEELDSYDLKSALNTIYAEEFTSEKPDQKQEIEMTLSLDNENFPQVTIAFYRYDGTDCLAMVDGEPMCLVRRSDVVDVIEAVNAIVLN